MFHSDSGPVRLALFAALFVALTVGGAAWALARAEVSFSDLRALTELPALIVASLAALCVAIYVADVIRYQLLGRAVGEALDWRAGLDASVANFFFSWITPGAAFGAPATIYMLRRRGVSWDGAALIAFGKSITSTTVLLAIAFVMLASGLGPGVGRAALTVLVTGTAVTVALLLLLAAGALYPAASTRRADAAIDWLARRRLLRGSRAQRVLAGLCSAIQRLARLRAGGTGLALALLACHVLYFAVFIAIAAVLALALGAPSAPRAVGVSTVYVAFTYVAPTPGGAGLAEATAVPFFGGLLSASDAVIAVITFRALTFYLHIVVGLAYLLVIGGIREIARGVRARR